ncbi:MAG: thioredoxin family protein [Candidatus Hydrothermarchaeota archaeon]
MPVRIKIFATPNCPRCEPTIEFVKNVVKEFEKDIEIRIIDIFKESSKALEYGIYAVPTVVINENVRFVGKLGKNDKKNLIDAIKREL